MSEGDRYVKLVEWSEEGAGKRGRFLAPRELTDLGEKSMLHDRGGQGGG